MKTTSCTTGNYTARNAAPARIEIGSGDAACIEDGRGLRITVERGAVWVTQHGSAEDICLATGESFRIACDGLTVATPIGREPGAVVSLEPTTREQATGGALRALWQALFAPRASIEIRAAA